MYKWWAYCISLQRDYFDTKRKKRSPFSLPSNTRPLIERRISHFPCFWHFVSRKWKLQEKKSRLPLLAKNMNRVHLKENWSLSMIYTSLHKHTVKATAWEPLGSCISEKLPVLDMNQSYGENKVSYCSYASHTLLLTSIIKCLGYQTLSRHYKIVTLVTLFLIKNRHPKHKCNTAICQ